MRRYRRYPIFATAVIADKSSRSATPIETMVAVANLSIAGMGIYSFTPLEKGKAVSIDITFVDEQKSEHRERIEGRIVWSTKKDGLSWVSSLTRT